MCCQQTLSYSNKLTNAECIAVVGRANQKISFDNRQSANSKVSFAITKLLEQLAEVDDNC